jgi:hypothetical protein
MLRFTRHSQYCKVDELKYITMGAIDLGNFNIDDSAAVISNNPDQIYEEYNLLREKCPVAHTSRYNGYWLLTR